MTDCFRRCWYSTSVYGNEGEGCRHGWHDIRARIVQAAEGVAT